MSGDEITKVGIWDDRLKPTTPSYAIQHGASSITSQTFAALSNSTSQHVYSVNVPSLQTYVDRFVLWQSTVAMQFVITQSSSIAAGNGSGTPAFASTIETVTYSYVAPVAASGIDFALAAYPLHRLTTSMLLSINDVSTTLNTAQVLPTLLRLLDDEQQRENVTTPTKLDVFASSASARGAAAGPYTAFDSAVYGLEAPNGSYPFQYIVPSNAVTGITTAGLGNGGATQTLFVLPIPSINSTTGVWSNTTTITTFGAGAQTCFQPGVALNASSNGFYFDPTLGGVATPYLVLVVGGVPYQTTYKVSTLASAAIVTATSGVLAWTVGVQYTLTENLLTSPFTAGGPAATVDSAMFGINNFQLTCQMQTPASARVIRQLDPGRTITGAAYINVPSATQPFTNARLLCNFLTPPVSLHVPARSTVPYQELVAYPFTNQSPLSAFTSGAINSNVVTFSQIPDYVIIKTAPGNSGTAGSGLDCTTPLYGDMNLPVSNVNVTFDNASGLLSALPMQRLWYLSKENGMNMPWLQWSSGIGAVASGAPPGVWVANPSPGFIGGATGGAIQLTNTQNVSLSLTPTSGGELVLAFGKDIALYETLAPGCSGNFAFFVTVTVTNTLPFAVVPTITLIAVNSGFWTCVGGQSSRTTTPLTQPQVLASAQSHKDTGGLGASNMDVKRLVGSGWWDHVASGISKGRDLWQQHGAKLADYAGKAAELADRVGVPGAKRARDAIGMVSSALGGSGKGIEGRFC